MPQLDEIAIRMASTFNAKDVTSLASLYDETAILMPPGEPAVQGRAAIQEWFAGALPRLGAIEIVPADTCALGEIAFQIGAFKIATHDSGIRGKYMLILHQASGDWLIQHDIWNLDQTTTPIT